ncbi:MAG: ArnT family glycosyltransferase [Candidatus Dormibacteraceae bacterium]
MLLAAVAVFAICRLPSFFEPHWYTDEAGYSTTARSVLRGAALYSQAWTNKPPIQIWLVAIPIRLFGPSEAGLHALTFLAGLIALVAAAGIAHRLLGRGRAMAATIALGIVLGLPLFNTELIVPESLLIAPATCAAAILVGRLLLAGPPTSWWWQWGWAVATGALAGIAIGIQQTSLADAGAFALVIILSTRIRRREILLYAGGVALVTAAWLGPSIAVASPADVASALVGFYRGYASFSVPRSHTGLALRATGPALALIGAFLNRRDARPVWSLWLWAAAVLAVPAIANRNYPHLLAPALVPGILAVASLPLPFRGFRPRLVPLVAGVAMTSVFASVAWIESKALEAYLTWPHAVATGHEAEWSLTLDSRGPSAEAIANWIHAHGLAGSRAVVWSSDAWLYMLADLPVSLPTAPIYNDVVLLGSGRAVAARVTAIDPRVIVTTEGATRLWPDIEPLLARRYRLAFVSHRDRVYLRTVT